MGFVKDDKKILFIVIVVLFILSIFTLFLRILPLLKMGSTDILNIVGLDDSLYNLRQIELMLANYPAYNWFDAMTMYPTGQSVPWGPMFTWLGATLAFFAGASTRTEIVQVVLWLPPLLATLMVPVMYILVRKSWNWKAGLFAAALISIVGGRFFFQSLAGNLDHHIAEVFFSTIFCGVYIYALVYLREHPVDFKAKDTWKMPVVFSAASGLAYVLGFLTMSTMIIFAFIVTLSTVVLFIIDFYHGRSSEYLLVLNGVTFGIVFFLSLLLGVISGGISEGFGLYFYTLAHPISSLFLILGTGILYVLSGYLKGKNFLLFPASIIGLGIIAFLGLFILFPDIYRAFNNGFNVFFGLNPYAATVLEARPLTIAEAWQSFNYGILLIIVGAFVLLYKSWKEYRAEYIFILVWSLFIILATIRQVRYEYYLAVNIAMLGAISLDFFLNRAWLDIQIMGKRATVKEPEVEFKDEPKTRIPYRKIFIAGFICVLALMFTVTSFQTDYLVASSGVIGMNPDWRESLEWMNIHTPETGVGYNTIYDKDNFIYPNQSYGVMSWWDYGHMITYIAKRIPNANPFQSGVAGPNGAAAFFMATSENTANDIMKKVGTRYIITDIDIDTEKFWTMATWFNTSTGVEPYQRLYLTASPGNPNRYDVVILYNIPYFQTMVSKLHNFDGSMAEPTSAYYVEYSEPGSSGRPYPLLKNAENMDLATAKAKTDRFNSNAPADQHAATLSDTIFLPLSSIPALQHYRLVHESPQNVLSGNLPDIKYVKVFEFVPGAKIKGEGIIEIPLVSNAGRAFVYRQASINGEFIVPYSTTGNPYDVKATGKYRIAGTSSEFDVSEDAVMVGGHIN